jgi:hypothetical protein
MPSCLVIRTGLSACQDPHEDHPHIMQNRMFAAVVTHLRTPLGLGHISAEGQLVDPVAEPEIFMTAAHAASDHHHSPAAPATDESPAAPRRVRSSRNPALTQLVTS